MDERNSSTSGSRSEPGGTAQDSGMADKVRARAAAQLNTQKDRATDGIGSVAQAVRDTTQHLRERQHDTVAQYVEQAADRLERFSTSLKNKDVGELVEDAQRLARRQPALFVGGAFALGLVGARFFKSSPSNERDDYHRGYRSGYGATYGTETYRGAAGSGEYGRSDWRSPGSSAGAAATGTMTGAAGAGYTGAGASVSGTSGSTTNRSTSSTSGAAGGPEPSTRRATGEGSSRSRTKTDSERS
jgi:hypothetical protein